MNSNPLDFPTVISPALPDWIRDHMSRYLATAGADGHIWRGVPTLLLATRGRKTGTWSALPLIYGQHDGAWIIVASKGGHAAHPGWYLNLVAHPEVQIQVGAERQVVTARTATGAERTARWAEMLQVWPAYAEYQNATRREIPVVMLERD